MILHILMDFVNAPVEGAGLVCKHCSFFERLFPFPHSLLQNGSRNQGVLKCLVETECLRSPGEETV